MGFVQVGVSDFSELGFAPGKVRGARAFEPGVKGSVGILTGIVYRQWWLPGIMRCTCLKRAERDAYVEMYNDGQGVDILGNPERFPLPDHTMEHCEHGLYGFYDGSNDYHRYEAGRIQGVIEGWGEVMIGGRGFRSTEAKLIALCDEGRNDPDMKLLRDNYFQIPWFHNFDEMIAEYPLGEVQ